MASRGRSMIAPTLLFHLPHKPKFTGKDKPMSYKTDPMPRPRADFLCDTAGSILSIHVRGEIDHHTSSAIRTGIDSTLFEKRPQKLILDLSGVSFMDSSGLGLIMGRYALVKQYGGTLAVLDPSPAVLKIIRLAGMERMVSVLRTKGKNEEHNK